MFDSAESDRAKKEPSSDSETWEPRGRVGMFKFVLLLLARHLLLLAMHLLLIAFCFYQG